MKRGQARSDAPGGPLGTAVAILESLLETPRLALWDVRQGALHLRYAHPKLRSRAQETWAAHRSDLLGGRSVQVDGRVYLPLLRERLVGVLEAVDARTGPLDAFTENTLVFTLYALPDALAPAELSEQPAAAAAPRAQEREAKPLEVPARVPRDVADMLARQKLRTLIERHAGNMAKVGRVLRVHRVTVWRRMKRLGVERLQPSPKQPRKHSPPVLPEPAGA